MVLNYSGKLGEVWSVQICAQVWFDSPDVASIEAMCWPLALAVWPCLVQA